VPLPLLIGGLARLPGTPWLLSLLGLLLELLGAHRLRVGRRGGRDPGVQRKRALLHPHLVEGVVFRSVRCDVSA